jgi:hypothetical protein
VARPIGRLRWRQWLIYGPLHVAAGEPVTPALFDVYAGVVNPHAAGLSGSLGMATLSSTTTNIALYRFKVQNYTPYPAHVTVNPTASAVVSRRLTRASVSFAPLPDLQNPHCPFTGFRPATVSATQCISTAGLDGFTDYQPATLPLTLGTIGAMISGGAVPATPCPVAQSWCKPNTWLVPAKGTTTGQYGQTDVYVTAKDLFVWDPADSPGTVGDFSNVVHPTTGSPYRLYGRLEFEYGINDGDGFEAVWINRWKYVKFLDGFSFEVRFDNNHSASVRTSLTDGSDVPLGPGEYPIAFTLFNVLKTTDLKSEEKCAIESS